MLLLYQVIQKYFIFQLLHKPTQTKTKVQKVTVKATVQATVTTVQQLNYHQDNPFTLQPWKNSVRCHLDFPLYLSLLILVRLGVVLVEVSHHILQI